VLVMTWKFVPESRAAHPRRLDPLGQVLVLVTLAALVYGIIEGPNAGWASAEILGCFALAAVALATLLWWESRRREPLLELRFFRSAPFAGATVLAVCAFAALNGFLFLNSVYLQDVRGFSALKAGLFTLPIAVMTLVFAPIAGRMVAARGPRRPLVIAGIALTVSSAMLLGLSNHTANWWLLLAYVVFGLGIAMVNPPITNSAVSGMPVSQAGVAAAVASTSRQVGVSLGVAVIGSAVTSRIAGPIAIDFAAASHVGWWIAAGCGVVVLAGAFVTTGRWAKRTAERLAPELVGAST